MGGEKSPLLRFVVFTVVCAVFAYWLAATLGNWAPFADRTTYTARFADDVTGLLVNDNVKISGVTVGKVTGLDIADGGAAEVSFVVDDSVDIPTDSTVVVRWRDTFGLRFLYVEPGESSDMIVAGENDVDFPDDQTAAPTSIGAFLSRATPFIDALDPELQNQVLQALEESIVGREEQLREIVRDGGNLTQAVASRDEELGRLLDNSSIILDEYAQRDEDIRALVDSLVDITDTLARRNDTLDNAVTGLADLQEEFGTLVEANEDDLRAALAALETTAETLAVNSDQLDTVLTRSPSLIGYHRVSRIGQWFNVRAVGVATDYQPVTEEKGATLPPRDGSSSNAASMFRAPLGFGEGR